METGAPFSAAYLYRPAGLRCAGYDLAKERYLSGCWKSVAIRGLGNLVLNVADICWRYPACTTPGDIFGSDYNRTNQRRNDGLSLERLYQSLPPPPDAAFAISSSA